jgi:hypothetical protein
MKNYFEKKTYLIVIEQESRKLGRGGCGPIRAFRPTPAATLPSHSQNP